MVQICATHQWFMLNLLLILKSAARLSFLPMRQIFRSFNSRPKIQFILQKQPKWFMGKFFVRIWFIYSLFRQVAGVDLNCGCPKNDVRRDGFGSKLLESPELIADIVKQTRARISDPTFTVSTKIRIKYPLEETVDLCRKVAFKASCFLHSYF